MSVEILVPRLRSVIKAEVEATHREMDKGQSRRRYNQLVGKIQALTWMFDTLKEETQKLGEDLERD